MTNDEKQTLMLRVHTLLYSLGINTPTVAILRVALFSRHAMVDWDAVAVEFEKHFPRGDRAEFVGRDAYRRTLEKHIREHEERTEPR